MKTIPCLLFALFILISVGCKTYPLTEQDKAWIPYNENDTLIFSSNTGEVDTVFVLGTASAKYASDALDFFPTYNHTYGINSRRSDPSPPPGERQRRIQEADKIVASIQNKKWWQFW